MSVFASYKQKQTSASRPITRAHRAPSRPRDQLAENQGNAQAIVASELGITKVFHRFTDDDKPAVDFASANSMQDIGRKLLHSVGFREPDDVSIAAAIEANDAFIERLEAIRDEAGQTIDDDD